MRILFVHGTDYSATDFDNYLEENDMSLEEAWDMVVDEDGCWTHEDGDKYFEVEIREFGEVDLDFITFLRDEIIDVDESKHNDFFVIEE